MRDREHDDNAGTDPEVDANLATRHIPEELSGPARFALEGFLDAWEPARIVEPPAILDRARQRVAEFPERWHVSHRDVSLQQILDIIETYDVMGWVEVDRSTEPEPRVVGVHPIYYKQSAGLRGEFIRNRQRRQRHRQLLKSQHDDLAATWPLMGLSTDDDEETLARKLGALGLEIKDVVANLPTHSFVAVVSSLRGSQIHRGHGQTRSEAICFASARAFLHSTGKLQS